MISSSSTLKATFKMYAIHIGNAMLLCYDRTWNALLEHYDDRGCLVDASFFPHQKN